MGCGVILKGVLIKASKKEEDEQDCFAHPLLFITFL